MTTSRIALTLSIAAVALAGCGSSSEEASTSNSPASKASSSSSTSATSDSSAETSTSAPATSETATSSETGDAMAGGSDAAAGAGMYLTSAEYETKKASLAGNKTVYFFAASWCPSCQAADKSLKAEGVPDGLTVVKVDFDKGTELKKKYGITQQHTFVQVDNSGKELKKWSGSVSGEGIKKQVA